MRILADLMMTDMEQSGMEVVIEGAFANILKFMGLLLCVLIHRNGRDDRDGAERNRGT